MRKHPKPQPTTTDDGLLLSREAMTLLRYTTVDGAIAYLRQQGFVPIRRGRAFLWKRTDVVALMAGTENSAHGTPRR